MQSPTCKNMLLAQLLRSLFNALPGNKYFAKGRFLETPKNIRFGSHELPYIGLFTYYHCLDHGNYPGKRGFSWAFFVPHLNSCIFLLSSSCKVERSSRSVLKWAMIIWSYEDQLHIYLTSISLLLALDQGLRCCKRMILPQSDLRLIHQMLFTRYHLIQLWPILNVGK